MKRREADKFFNVILNSIADGVFTTDNDGKITFMNKAGEEITGFSNREAIGHYCFDVFRADICQSRCALKETLKTKKEIINLPATILKKGGQKVPISVSTAVLKNERGQIMGGVETLGTSLRLKSSKRNFRGKYTVGDIISKNHLIHDIFNILPNIAESESTVLIQGASGTGKELFAKAIHNLSRRKDKALYQGELWCSSGYLA